MFKTSENTDKLFQAIFEFQKDCPTIEKKAKGGFKGSKYADRTDVIKEIRPLLVKNNIFFTQAASSAVGEYIGMTSRIIHVPSNQWIEITEHRAAGTVERGLSQPQADGCVLTYMSRQQLVYLFGIPLVGEDDEKALSNYLPTPKIAPVNYDNDFLSYYKRGKRLLEDMEVASPRSSAIYEYCERKGYESWMQIPPVNFKNDSDLHAALKLSGECENYN